MSARRSTLVLLVLVGLGAGKGLAGVAMGDGGQLQPDLDLYAQGGLGLFPSPLGRALGALGVGWVEAVNVVANAALVAGSVYLARALGGRPWAAGLIAAASPVGVWSMSVGMDATAAALLVWAAWALASGHTRAAAALAAVAVGFHLAALLIVAAWLLARAPRVGAICIGAGAVLVLSTGYAGLLSNLDPVSVVTGGAATAAVFGVGFLPLIDRLALAWPAIVGGAVAAGLVAAGPFETNVRYLLPAVAIGAAVVVSPARPTRPVVERGAA